MIKKITFVSAAVLLLAFGLLPVRSEALTITPAIRELSLTAGEKTTALVQLDNDGLETVSLTTQVVNFTAKGETGEPNFLLNDAKTGAAIWVELTSPIVIAAGQKVEVPVTFDVPAGTKAGGYYTAVLFNINDSTTATNPGDVAIESKMAVPFLLTVKGSYTESGAIAQFTTANGQTFFAKGPIDFVLRYQNTGDIHLKPAGSIVITNMFGKTVKTIKVNEDLGAVLPDTIRKFDIDGWEDVGLGFGRYTAKVTLATGGVTSSTEFAFWIISTTWLFLAIGLIIVLLIVLMALTRKPLISKKAAPDSK